MAEAFRNEPPIDFSRRENRQRFAQTLEKVRGQFKEPKPQARQRCMAGSVNPADTKEIVGRVRVSEHRSGAGGDRPGGADFFPSGAARRRKIAPRFSQSRARHHARETLGTRRLGGF